MAKEAKKAVPVTAPKENEDWLDSTEKEVKEVAKEGEKEVVHVAKSASHTLKVLSQRSGPIGVRGPNGTTINLTYNNPVELPVDVAQEVLAMFPGFIKIL